MLNHVSILAIVGRGYILKTSLSLKKSDIALHADLLNSTSRFRIAFTSSDGPPRETGAKRVFAMEGVSGYRALLRFCSVSCLFLESPQ